MNASKYMPILKKVSKKHKNILLLKSVKNLRFFRNYVWHIKKAEAGASAKTLPECLYQYLHNICIVLVFGFHSAS